VGEADDYDVTVQDGKIVLTPVPSRCRAREAREARHHVGWRRGCDCLGEKARVTRPRVVLDTNCLVSASIFSRGRFAWQALLAGEGASGAWRVVQYL